MKKYERVYKDLLEKIERGDYKAGESLPSEKKLMETYQVSRYTIRQAIDILVNSGYLLKKQGKESVVSEREKYTMPISEIKSFQEINEMEDRQAKTYVRDLDLVSDRNLNKKIFGIDSDEEVFKVVRLREIGGEKVILDTDYFRREIIGSLPLKECRNSIYRYLEEDRGTKIGYAVKEISCKRPTEEEKEIMDIDQYNVLVVVESNTYLEDNTIFQHTISKHRPDKFRFVDLSKRK